MPRTSASISPAYLARHGITPPRAPAGGTGRGKAAEEALYGSLRLLGIAFEAQYAWGRELVPPRKFQSDARVKGQPLLIEVDGQVHGIRDKRERDLERQNLGTLAGWSFLRFTPAQALDGSAALIVQQWLERVPVTEE